MYKIPHCLWEAVEWTQARLGGQEAVTPFTLRVTLIMRPEVGVWKIVHRHADPFTTAQPTESVFQ